MSTAILKCVSLSVSRINQVKNKRGEFEKMLYNHFCIKTNTIWTKKIKIIKNFYIYDSNFCFTVRTRLQDFRFKLRGAGYSGIILSFG